MVASTKAPSNRAHLRILCEFERVALAHAKVWNVLVRSCAAPAGPGCRHALGGGLPAGELVTTCSCVEQHNTQMPHAAFSGQTPDEMYFGTAANLPAELATANSNARAVRLATNRALSCETCLGQPARPTESQIPP